VRWRGRAGIPIVANTISYGDNVKKINIDDSQWAKSPKNSMKERVFVNSALKIQCHFVKNTLPQTAFSAILPTIRKLDRFRWPFRGLPKQSYNKKQRILQEPHVIKYRKAISNKVKSLRWSVHLYKMFSHWWKFSVL